MHINLKIKRFHPDKEDKPYYETFSVDIDGKESLLEALLIIRDHKDQTFGMRCSCKSAICGSCTMKVNKKTVLACNTSIKSIANEGDEILIEPAGNQGVIRDLIVDLNMFWDKIEATSPWLKSKETPKREYICSNESMLDLQPVSECILCGSCVSDCTVLEVDKQFMGPAALAKVYRFIADPRDDENKERLSEASKYGGIWDCTHCFRCIEACPKSVAPMDRILSLRKEAMDSGMTDNTGARHSKAIKDSVEHSGRLNEMTVLPKSHGYTNIKEMLALIPGGIRMIKRGKMPSPFHKPIKNVENVKKIFKKFDKK